MAGKGAEEAEKIKRIVFARAGRPLPNMFRHVIVLTCGGSRMATKSDLPTFESYFVPTVYALRNRGGSATIEEMEDDVADLMKLSGDVRSVLHGDGPRTQFEYELAWVRTYLKKIGMVENSERGVWRPKKV